MATHLHREARGCQARVRTWEGVIEEHDKPIPSEALQCSCELMNQLPKRRMIVTQQLHDLLWLGGFLQRR